MTEFSPAHRKITIIIASLGTSMGFIDATALNVALPFIQSSLNASATDIHWVLEIYLLFLAALMMAGGALGDSMGRRKPLRWGVAAFGITSLGCALSSSAEMLILFRAFQGIAAALMIPATLALINASFPPEDRGEAIGKWSSVVALTIPLGPLVGGLAVDYVSWHMVFLLNIPICLIMLGLLAILPRPPFEPPVGQPLDKLGSLTITASLGLITYAMLESGRIGAFSPYEAAFLAAGICLFMLFFVVERYQKQPMLPLFLLKDRRFLLVTLQTLVLFAGFQSAMYFLSFLYIQSYEYTALQAGAATLPISIIVALISRSMGRAVVKYGPRLILFVSSVLMAVSLFWLSVTDGHYWSSVLPAMMVMGVSVGLFAAPLTTVAMAAAGPGRDGLASGVNNAVSRIGPLLAIAIFSFWIGGSFTSALQAYLDSTSLPADTKTYLWQMREMMAAIPISGDWPSEAQQQISITLKSIFADSIKNILRVSSACALLAGVLALFYRKTDAQ
ncbi:MAG: MFS transporter [Candidatus Puniceispirillaceae bacterium]|jgi:EmrB/QacA subfamily drug resistance transporter